MVKEIRKRVLATLLTLAMVVSLMPAVTLPAKATTFGTADGTYDFGGLGDLDSAGSGYRRLGDKFKVQNNIFWATTSVGESGGSLTALYLQVAATETIIIKAEGAGICGSFTFKNLGFSTFNDTLYPNDKRFTAFNIVLKDNLGAVLLNESLGSSAIISSTEIVQLSTLYGRSEWNVGGVSTIEIGYLLSEGDRGYLTFENITVANVSAYIAGPSITTQPNNATVNAGGDTSFTVGATGATGYQWQVNTGSGFENITNGGVYSNATTATLSISSATADMDGNEYKVVVSGSAEPAATSDAATLTVNAAPEIEVKGNDTTIADGDDAPSAADHTDFGSVATFAGTVVRTFTIKNTGSAALTLGGGSPYVTIGGAHAGDFSVTPIPAATIAASDSTTFQITFDPSALGTRTATVSIANNDSDENPYNFTIQGTGLNAAPVITNLNGDSVSFTEGGSAALLDSTSDATVTDGDNANFNGGNLTASITANRISAEDVLSIANNGTGAGQIGVSGANVSYGGITIGTFAGGTGTNDLVVTFNTSATPTAAEALIRSITYLNMNNADPSTTSRTVRITVSDGSGGTSANSDVTVSVTGINDAPTLSASGANPTYTENGAAVTLFSGASVSTVESEQKIIGLTLTVSNVSNGTAEILNIDGTDVALTNGNSATTATNSMNCVVSVVESTATVALSNAEGISTESMQTLVNGINYRNSSENPEIVNRVVTLKSIKDNGSTDSGGSDTRTVTIASTVKVVAVNDAPVLDDSGTMTLTSITEDAIAPAGDTVAAIIASAGGNKITDADSGASEGIAVTALSGDGTWQYNTGGGWNAIGAVSNASALLLSDADSLRFVPTVTYNNAQTATITFRAWDRTSGAHGDKADASINGGTTAFSTATETASLAVTAVNDVPSITGRPVSITVTESTASNVELSDATFSDPDSAANSITLTLTVGPGTLSASDVGGVTVTGSGTATLALTGTAANIDTYLNTASNIKYTGPAETFGENTATLTLTANDGGNTGDGSGVDVSLGTVSINITAIAPTVTKVTSNNVDKTYGLGETIEITVQFSHAVDVTDTPQLTLATVAGDRTANYSSGSGSNTLTFTYITQAGDETSDLNYKDINSLIGTIKRGTTNANLTLPATTDTGSLGTNKAIAIAAFPTVTLSVGSVNIEEAGGTSTIAATVPVASSQDVVVTLAYTGTAASGTDYNGTASTTITILAGSLSASAATGITATQDVATEGDETIVVSITGISKGVENGEQQQTITIQDDDIPYVTGVSSSTANGSYKAGDNIAVTVTFSAAVTVTGTPKLLVETGTTDRTIDYISGSGSAVLTFIYTVQAGDNSTDLDYVSTESLTLSGGSIKSGGVNASLTLPAPGAAGSLGANKAIVIDTTPPTASIALSDTALRVGETSTVTITFSEKVMGFANEDLTFAKGTLSPVGTSDGGTTWTATFTPTADMEYTTNIITLTLSNVTDLVGNAGTGTVNSDNYAIDTLRPTATIVVSDNALKAGETSPVTITFSEAVTGFSNADLTVVSGTLSSVASSDGGITWTATFTPTANVENASNIITLDNTGVQDAAGNTGTGATNSGNYAIETKRPTATIVVSDTILKVGETSAVTITFSEAVTGFENADLTVLSGTLAAVSSSDGGITWTATFTPTADIEDSFNVITLDNTGVLDAAGNTGTGVTDSNNYAIDTKRPTATIVVSDTSLSVGETSTVTITFTEAVTNFTSADLTVANGTLTAVISANGGITWTATFTPTSATQEASNVITLDNSGVLDAAGNSGVGTSNSNNYVVDTVRPIATITVSDTALKAGETSTVTITFSEAVTGFTTADLNVANGTLSGLSSSDGGITWTSTLTPTANVENTSNIITLDNMGVQDTAGNAGTGTTSSNNYAIDTKQPTATIVVSDNALKIGETSAVTITFSEAVTGFENADLTVANGTLTAVSSANGGITWTATFTPTIDIEDATNVITLDNTGVLDAAGNTGTGTTDSGNYAIDTKRPTATITVSDDALKIGETSSVTITFSEAVTGFENADLTVVSGTLTAVSSTNGGITWTATFTPAANVVDASNIITLNNTGVLDVAGNAGTGTTDSGNYAIDTLRPTATITVSDTALKVGETSLVTITFSEAVTGFTNADLTVVSGTLTDVSSSDGGITWTATFTPTADIEDASNFITLDNTGVLDAAGNTGTGTTDSDNYAIDTKRPTATIVVNNNALKIGETSSVTITFSEAVTGFENADLTVVSGTLTAVSSTNGGITWTATFTPAANVVDDSNVITLNNSGVQDIAGNTGIGTTSSGIYVIDTLRPTATITVSDNALKVGETSLVTITFSEAVTGFTNTDLTIVSGTLTDVSSSDGGITWTATFTPTVDIEDATNVFTLDNTGVLDAAGNAGTGTTDSGNYAIDTKRPTATIVVSDTALKVGETSAVTITFSEAVTGLENADLTIVSGTLTAVISTNGGITWSATFTPTTDIEDATNVITLDNSGVLDVAGNTGTDTTSSNNYAIDTKRPTATITVSDDALKVGETSAVTITFSEAVTGFENADLTVANGTLTAVSSANGGITWTATFTPTANVIDASNFITLNNTGVLDVAGNAGTGTTDSGNYAIDTLRPTATITVSDTALKAGETSLVTIAFSEAVTGFTNADLTVVSGTLTDVSSSEGGITWTATFTPTADIEDASNFITLDTTGVLDAAGNSGIGTTDSGNYTIDTKRPTATITVSDTALKVGETSLVTLTFSEAVTGFINDDLTVANGTLTAVSSANGGITWTATFTPTIDIEDATNVISLDNTGVLDAAGNTGTGTVNSDNYAIDTLRPTTTIVVSDTALKAGETSLVTITFAEAVTGFTNADLTVVSGTLTDVSSSDGGTTWTATFTPTADIEDSSNVITLDNTGVLDAAGNTGTGTTDSGNYAIDTKRPTATIVVSDTSLIVGETSTVTITFTEAVTNFTSADLTVVNGALSGLSSSDGGITWTATFTPTADIEDSSNVFTLDNTGVLDVAGNAGTGATDSGNYAIDTKRPTATITVSDDALKIGETSSLTITFSEAVTGFTNADLTVVSGTLTDVSSSDGGITWTATFTPTEDIEDATNVITLDNTGVLDAAGNTGTDTISSNNYAIDTLRPTATITVSDTALMVGETSLVTITFSEAVTGFDNADLTVVSGTLTDVSSSDGGITWTATFTPTADIEDATNVFTLDNTGVLDGAGNAGTGTTDSGNYAIDTKRPTATIVVSDTALKVGETSAVTITFSEAVTGLENADLTVVSGTLTAFISTNGGITWSATFTPTTDIEDATNVITLDNSGVLDVAGNTGTGATDSGNYAIDTKRPTATITVSDTALKVDETSSVTFIFSEAVSGLTVGDVTVNGVLTNLNSSGGGITWTATLTPPANTEAMTNVITLDNFGIQDAAGNTGTGTTDSNNYKIDTKRPTVVSVAVPNYGKYKVDDILSFTVNFSEAVAVTGTPTLSLDIGGASVNAVYVSDDDTSALVFAYIIIDGNTDMNGIEVDTLGLNGGTLKDAAGNDATLTLNNVGSPTGVLVDTTAPAAGNSGTIGVSELTYNSVKLTWTAATDTSTLLENLQYMVVFSTSNNIMSLSDVESNGTAFGGWTTNIITATVTGLTASTDYYFNVLVKDETGNKALYSSITATTTAAPVYTPPSTPTTPSSAVVEVNGEKQDAGQTSTQTTEGTTTTTITVDDTKLNKILEQKGNNATVTLPTSGTPDVVVGELTGQTVKNMETKEAVLEIKTATVSYTLPASQINIDSVSSQLGSQVELKDIKVSVKIAEPPADTVKVVEDTASKGNYQIVVKPVEFEITCTSGDTIVEVSRFNGYVERTIAIPEGVDPSKITTGVVLNADGTLTHVPTQIVVINGKYFAKINSLTNSTYSVIYNPITFTDVANHWAKDAVNDMGSRMVVTGIGNGIYEPERSITRAEFAAIVVRALGLKKGTTESAFGDVTLTDWFNGYVDTATAYSLITGYSSESYGPNDTITREQSMAILMRAMKITGLSVTLTGTETSALLSNYTDAGYISDYAKAGVAACIKTGVVSGTTASTLSPKDSVTRAEVAVMVQRLLEKSGLI